MSSATRHTMLALTMLACVGSSILGINAAVAPRDEWQPGPSYLRCIYMTNGRNWTGEGLRICGEPGQCVNKIPDGLTAKVTSAGADRNATCILFSEQYCKGVQSVPIMHGGYGDLTDVDFCEKTMSFKCFDNTGVRDSECAVIDG